MTVFKTRYHIDIKIVYSIRMFTANLILSFFYFFLITLRKSCPQEHKIFCGLYKEYPVVQSVTIGCIVKEDAQYYQIPVSLSYTLLFAFT